MAAWRLKLVSLSMLKLSSCAGLDLLQSDDGWRERAKRGFARASDHEKKLKNRSTKNILIRIEKSWDLFKIKLVRGIGYRKGSSSSDIQHWLGRSIQEILEAGHLFSSENTLTYITAFLSLMFLYQSKKSAQSKTKMRVRMDDEERDSFRMLLVMKTIEAFILKWKINMM